MKQMKQIRIEPRDGGYDASPIFPTIKLDTSKSNSNSPDFTDRPIAPELSTRQVSSNDASSHTGVRQ